MYKKIGILFVIVILILILIHVLHHPVRYNLHQEELKQQFAQKHIASVDHSKLTALQREFSTPQEVTEACISCHTERHKEVMQSSHWNWERLSYIEGRGVEILGKKNLLNNYCIGSKSNEQACAKCHIGFGMTNDHFDFNNARNVDCMVCHDNSEEYLKGSALAGYPARNINLSKVAQSVGSPRKSNCGACHFYSGGGNNVKHGDLEESLLSCDRDVDVHMAGNGFDMECVTCHTAPNHHMKGKLYSVSSENIDRATCEQCHTHTPHLDNFLNRHTARISCQACHIPIYAKVNSTKMEWRWSEAGKLKDGKPYELDDSLGNHTYLSIKGEFKWDRNVVPEYVWFNGTADHYILGDVIDTVPVQINTLNGSYEDLTSKIMPVKVHRGDQIYDKKYNRFIQPKLFGQEHGDSAYWQDFDWKTAAEAGMKRIGLEFSGEYGFIGTEMYWPINHMVAPKEQSLKCMDCHTRDNGRLASLAGFYMPGRDRNKTVDMLGKLLIIFAFAGVMVHAAARILTSLYKKEYKTEVINYDKDEEDIHI